MAAAEARFNQALSEYQQNQESYDESKTKVKKEFQEEKDSGLVSDDQNIASWIYQNQPAFMAKQQSLDAAVAQMQAAARARWGADAEGELKKLGLSRDEIVVKTIRPGQPIFLPSVGKVEF